MAASEIPPPAATSAVPAGSPARLRPLSDPAIVALGKDMSVCQSVEHRLGAALSNNEANERVPTPPQYDDGSDETASAVYNARRQSTQPARRTLD
jgi:hypothetical protein